MNFQDWCRQLSLLESDVTERQSQLDSAVEKRNSFLMETIGMAPRGVATLEGTIAMVGKIVDMKLSSTPEAT